MGRRLCGKIDALAENIPDKKTKKDEFEDRLRLWRIGQKTLLYYDSVIVRWVSLTLDELVISYGAVYTEQ